MMSPRAAGPSAMTFQAPDSGCLSREIQQRNVFAA
jgi:hypothetical protein